MEPEVIILKPGELILKSKGVRREFEKRLIFNVKDCLKKKEIEFDHIIRGQGRYFIYTPEPEEVISAVKNIFGIANLCAAAQVGAKLTAIQGAILDLAKDLGVNSKKSFGIRATTISTDLKSRDLEKEIGAFIQQKTKAKVNLTKPDFWLRVEVVNNKAFVYSEIITGLNGLPLGTSGKVIAMISEKEKDVLAAWMIMRRGAEIIPIHIRNDEKKLTLSQKNVKKLNKFAYGSRIKPISIKSKVEINKIIKEKNVKALVFGSTKFHARKENLPVFEPLIGLDKKQLKVLEKIVL
ncbi:hypothetical protein HN924_00985 [Candidatus Woesearchaeota archaeon]|jgi:tRNA uracil 4-sulfurtransferase|nr:hypothetical protein [Candidatus Woesearchaeota archaeon]MBT7402520.1 hypothetical protein [Candidatus Woesearchaeota archaeon]